MDFVYRFPVVEGVQAGGSYYIAMVPLKMLPRLFAGDSDCVQPEFRAQRRLNEQRIPEICSYILDNPDSYVFSAIAASVDGKIEFSRISTGPLGYLEIAMDSTFLINDGQHRIASICEALIERPALGEETISVVLFEDKGLARSQQMFTDLNKHAVRTSNSISELYDSRDELAVATRECVKKVDFLNRYTDKERDNLGKLSAALFTLNMFYKANKRIAGKASLDDDFQKYLLEYWSTICAHMEPWADLDSKKISKQDLRERTISTQSVFIQALGRVGTSLRSENTGLEVLEKLEEIDWSRDSSMWALRTISEKGRVITNESAIVLTANAIKTAIGIVLSSDEKEREGEFALAKQEK